jgi:glycine/D-amino acid oxidase-like deaminating enzyme
MTSLWLSGAPAFELGSPIPEQVDVLVIGAGIAGTSAALGLSRLGARVGVVDAGEVGGRASGRNDGQLLLGLGEHYNRIVGQFGAERARMLWDFIRRNHEATRTVLSDHGVDCGLVQQGGLRMAETPHEAEELSQAADLLAAEGIQHELLDTLALANRFRAGRNYHGALFLPGEAILDPARMVRGIARIAADAGAAFAERTAVRRIEGDAGSLMADLTDGRQITATAVLHCTSTLGRELDDSGFLSRVVFPFRGQVVATDPLPATALSQFPRCAMSSNFCYEYFRVHGDRLFLGGMRWSVPGEETGILDDETHNADVSRNLCDYAARHFDCGMPLQFPHVWTGIMAGTPDSLPLLGALPGKPGQFVLGAFNGYGLSFAFLAGLRVAELIVEGRSDDPALPLFAPRRFS